MENHEVLPEIEGSTRWGRMKILLETSIVKIPAIFEKATSGRYENVS
jgi:hypothetical protein